MEEVIRADRFGNIVPSLAQSYRWIDQKTVEFVLRRDVHYHNGENFSADIVKLNFRQTKRWIAPHPPGTWLNLPNGSELEIIDDFTIRFHFPKPDGLAVAKMRAHHNANHLFWQQIGFGYAKTGSGEGHW
ncbi:ABC transporter substrate-binding protein [Pseudalkalibacillus hwajinpoensis]|uniref:ABC transporter substrate-binding protein n=2 Tax=Guptibacillus hwajinpoensis TaxID=208199 RepID=A0A4U1MPD1_9BACL|nr:ABC transporter substrate-binding protein [Pseudalkalibacillus hwajinpoensis]